MKPTKPSKDTLDQYVFDYGIERSKEIFHLTTSAFNDIMFGKPLGVVANSVTVNDKVYQQFSAPTGHNVEHIKRVIVDRYDDLRKTFVKTPFKIDIRGLSNEDKLHNTLLKVLKNSDSFEYENDENTYRYICNACKNHKIDKQRQVDIHKNHIHIFKILFNFEIDPELECSILDNAGLIAELSHREFMILSMLRAGYKQRDIATKLKVSDTMISKNIKRIKTKVLTYSLKIDHNTKLSEYE